MPSALDLLLLLYFCMISFILDHAASVHPTSPEICTYYLSVTSQPGPITLSGYKIMSQKCFYVYLNKEIFNLILI